MERDHFLLVAQRNDSRLPLVGAVVIFFLFVADIRGRKNKLEDKASSPLACEQALPPPSLPTPVPLAHRLAAFFFHWSKLCNNPLMCTFEPDLLKSRNSPSRGCCIPTVLESICDFICKISVRCNYKHLCTQKGVLNWGNLAWQIVSLLTVT